MEDFLHEATDVMVRALEVAGSWCTWIWEMTFERLLMSGRYF